MSALPEHFAELIRKTLPTGERLDLAKKWPDRIRDHIQEHEFATVHPHTRLAGSYGRRTAVKDIKDVDVLVFVPEDAEDEAPKDLLKSLEEALQEFPDASVDCQAQRRSVRVRIEKDDFDIDVVPAIIKGEDHHGVLLVPDKTRAEWLDSQPIGYADALADLNQAHDEKVKPQIRLLKLWRDLRMTYMRPKSYWLECLAYHAFDQGKVDGDGKSSGPLFADLLQYLVDRLSPSIDAGGVPHIADPMLGNNVASGWEHSHAKALLTRLREDADRARRAVDAEDDDDAAELWSKVFPGEFPQDPAEDKKAAASVILGSRAAVTPAGILVSTRTREAVDLPPVKYHGDDGQ